MTAGPGPDPELPRRRYGVGDYRRMAEVGILKPGERLELIDGAILEVPPVGARRATLVDRLARALGSAVGDRATLSARSPVVLAPHSEPEPDVALVGASAEVAGDGSPAVAYVLLVAEVGDEATLRYVHDVKVPLYARCGVLETWLVDDRARTLTRFADPREGGYATRDLPGLSGPLEPVAFPGVAVGLAGLFED